MHKQSWFTVLQASVILRAFNDLLFFSVLLQNLINTLTYAVDRKLLSTWGSWIECSASCGTGMTSRNRSCSNPKASNERDHCFGVSTEYQLCNKVPCPGIYPIRVLCIMDIEQGGWTVIQKRETANDFYKNWQDNRTGFGDDTNFGNSELRIDMMRNNNERAAAKYQIFSVGIETMLYKLSIGHYRFDPAFNDPGDSFLYHDGMNFSTYDNDNDADSTRNCAVARKGGYWYRFCAWNNLNGLYGSTADHLVINWYSWTDFIESLTYTRMMIRPNRNY